jgi:hypothetical protein
VQQVGTFPPASAGISLGDLVKRADGTEHSATTGVPNKLHVRPLDG